MFHFKQKTVYEMRMSDWSSDVCSSDLLDLLDVPQGNVAEHHLVVARRPAVHLDVEARPRAGEEGVGALRRPGAVDAAHGGRQVGGAGDGDVGDARQPVARRLHVGALLKILRILDDDTGGEIGRAAWRERVCEYV